MGLRSMTSGRKTLYERGNDTRDDQSTGWAMGRITKVNPETRLLEVKTFFGSNPSCEDLHLPNCQWLNQDANPEGDESGSIPREGSIGLVIFIQGEPFMWGFMSPKTNKLEAAGEVREQVNAGDKILKTIGENKIVLRSHGEIEIQSTNSCKTIYFPDQHLINTLCRNYEMRTDGGSIDWVNDNGRTSHTTEHRTDLLRSGVIQEVKGYVNATTVEKKQIGVGIPGAIPGANMIPVWEYEVSRIGATKLNIHPPGVPLGFSANIQPTGAFGIEVGKGQFKLDVAPTGATKISVNKLCEVEIAATGATTVKVGGGLVKMELTPSGKLSIDASTGVEVTTKASCKIDAMAGVTVSSKANVKVEALSGITLDSKSSVTINALSGITLAGSGTGSAFGKVLVFPTALSDFTGMPIQQGSSTIKGSV